MAIWLKKEVGVSSGHFGKEKWGWFYFNFTELYKLFGGASIFSQVHDSKNHNIQKKFKYND